MINSSFAWDFEERYALFAQTKRVKVFARLFQKAARIQRRGALVAPRKGRNSLNGVSLLLTFLFAPVVSKRKVAKAFILFSP